MVSNYVTSPSSCVALTAGAIFSFSSRKASKLSTSEAGPFSFSALKLVPALGQQAECSAEVLSYEQRQLLAGGASSQLLHVRSRAWLPRVLLLPPTTLGCKLGQLQGHQFGMIYQNYKCMCPFQSISRNLSYRYSCRSKITLQYCL